MERKRDTIEILGLPPHVYDVVKKHIGYIDALVFYGEEGLREISGIGDDSIAIIKEAMKKYGVELPVEKTRRVVLFEEISSVNSNIKAQVYKWVPGPEEYTVVISEYTGGHMWIIQNWRSSRKGEPIILPPVFTSLEEAVQCAKELLKEYENKEEYIMS